MSAVYTAREARTRFAELLRRVRGGETVTVSYRGAPIAEMRSPVKIVPPAEIAAAPPPSAPPLSEGENDVHSQPPAPSLSEEELEARMADMRRRGILYPANGPKQPFKPVCSSPGALARFLAERD